MQQQCHKVVFAKPSQEGHLLKIVARMSKILVVDDEPDIVDLVCMHLLREGHETVSVSTGFEAVPTAVKEEPDLILLDFMLPGLDGIQLLRRLKMDSRTRHIPVIMLTAKSQINDRITGLEAGADDYLTKPFSPRELMLRINAVLRRAKKVSALTDERIGAFRIDRKNMTLTINDKLVNLTITELKLITVLMENANQMYSRSELLNLVWGHADYSQSRTLDTHVKRLREKLGEYGVHVQTVRGQGYIFKTAGVGEPHKADETTLT
jgi:two-component system, OmpR family, phosphate regulon response regulator PhoB